MMRLLLAFVLFCGTVITPHSSHAQTSFNASAGGSVIPGYDNRTCDSSIVGAIRYNSASITAAPTDYTHRWTMDETSGTTVTDSGGSSNGTWQGSASVVSVAGKIGTALYFDGTNNYITVPDAASLELQTNMTVSMWIKPDAAGLGSDERILWKDHSVSPWYGWEVSTTSDFMMFDVVDNVPNYTTVGSARVYGDKWYHFVGTLSGGANLIPYLNGVRSEAWNDGAVPGSIFTTSDGPLGIGSDPTGSSNRFQGAIDDIRIYNRTLSAAEIYQLYVEGLNGSAGTGCVEYCNGSSWVCPDTDIAGVTGGGGGGGNIVTFSDKTEATMAAVIASDTIKVSLASSQSISISGSGSPEYQICADANCNTVNQAWTSTAGTISDGEHVQIRATSSSSPNTTSTVTLTIGSSDLVWTMTTGNIRIIFASSAAYNGNFGGQAGADAACQTLASNAGLGSNFYAWIATSSSNDPNSRFTKSNNEYQLVDGTVIANNYADLTDGTIANPISLDENGTGAGLAIITGVDEFGDFITSSTACQGLTSSSSSDFIPYGFTNATNASWTHDGNSMYCDSTSPPTSIYCVQQ